MSKLTSNIKPSVILHNKYSLNYSKLKDIWIYIVYI